MKLLEKLKNTFFEEEEYLVDEPKKEEKISKKVETKVIKKKEPEVEKIKIEKEEPIVEEEVLDFEEEPEEEIEEVSFSDSDLVRKNSKVSYYTDDDFVDTSYNIPVKEEPKKIYGGTQEQLYESIDLSNKNVDLYGYGESMKGKFQPTPIISPIYGILDKNYNKDEIVDKKDRPSSYVSTKNVDLDSVRRKAYGEKAVTKEEKEEFPSFEGEAEDQLLYDMMVDDTKPVVNEVTIADAEEYFDDLGLEYNVDYKDAHYEKATGRRTKTTAEEEPIIAKEDVVQINDNNVYEEDNEQNDYDEVIINKNTESDVEEGATLEDNLFDLVDSIYEGGEE